MNTSFKTILQSIVLAIVGMLLGSVLASVAVNTIHASELIENGLANMLLDAGILISQIIVIKQNKIKIQFKRTKSSYIIASLVLTATMVFLSFKALEIKNIISYKGTGFQYSTNKDVYGFVAVLFIQMFVVAFTEELLFRGVLEQTLFSVLDSKKAILAATLIFTTFHCMEIQSFTQVTDIFLLGLILGILFYKTRSLFVPMVFHFGVDFFTNLVGMRGDTALFIIESRDSENYIVSNLFGAMSALGAIVLIVYFMIATRKSS